MEPRAAVATYDVAQNTFRLLVGNQGVTNVRDQIAAILGIEKHALVVTSGDVGGAFGIRGGAYPEYPALLHAARLLCAPVRWTATRSEAFVSDAQARDSRMSGRMALDETGRILALDVHAHASMGAYMHHVGYFIATANFTRCLPGPYDIPAVHGATTCVLTNTVPTAPYRGAGRPEAAYITESLIEAAADRLGITPVEIRRRNLIAREALPHSTAVGTTYDSGDFESLLDRALKTADWPGLEARRSAALKRGRLHGAGIGMFVEISGGLPFERAKMAIRNDGRIQVRTAIAATGQGHQTVFARFAAEQLAIPSDQIEVLAADSTGFQDGGSSSASRATTMAGLAIRQTSIELIRTCSTQAAAVLDVPVSSVRYEAGRFIAEGTNRSVGFGDLAAVAGEVISAEARIEAQPTWPNGCHIAEVEIDPETGELELVSFVAVDDSGRIIVPELAEGQVHGALAQGIGQVLFERAVYDQASGQLSSGSFLDYALPRADDLPRFVSVFAPCPATTNPLGTKGIGESGTVGPLPAIMNAVRDALRHVGVGDIEMPATPERIWRALQPVRNS